MKKLPNKADNSDFNYELHKLEDKVMAGELSRDADDDSSESLEFPKWPTNLKSTPYE